MRFLLLDDEPLALKDVQDSVREAVPDAEVVAFTLAEEALEFAKEQDNHIDVAFLDIELGYTTGLVVAKRLKDIQPDLNIIFVTSYEQYAVSAFKIHATGYLMKPVNPADISRELTFIYKAMKSDRANTVKIQTFGGFCIFVNDKALVFKRQKAKELLAYLVDRHGADITTRHACTLLWEDTPYDRKVKNYFQSVLLELRRTLREAGVEDILVRSRNSLAVDIAKFDCDSYRFMAGDPIAVNAYCNNYLSDYSWAEFAIGKFDTKVHDS